MSNPLRLGVLISGSGTTLQNLLDVSASHREEEASLALEGVKVDSLVSASPPPRVDPPLAHSTIPAKVVLVVSSKADARGLERARQRQIPTVVVDRREHESVETFSDIIFEACRSACVDLVCLAGFLHLVRIPADYNHRVLNIHPSLIPSFCGPGYYGMRVHRAVLEAGVKVTGCTVHFADDEYDHGPIILQKAVAVEEDDSPEVLAARVFAQECLAYPEAIRLFAENRLRVEGRRVRILS